MKSKKSKKRKKIKRQKRKTSRKQKAKKIAKKKKSLKVHQTKASVFPPEKIEELVNKGKSRGFVTFEEILYFFPEAELNIEGLDELYQRLENEGIKVKESGGFLEDIEKELLLGEAGVDPVQAYLKEIADTPTLTAEEEKELAKRIEKGDEKAKEKLIKANLKLVVSIAK
ncbi:RNA polymerase sigma factor RpoD, partial [Candidatus Parcubacteria bacterium]|nr:RNA polymerase sigma factor RpoD [Candidatus Parcubacteria bacterium]